MHTRHTLASLLSGIAASFSGDAEIEVTGIAYDSRQVRPGDVFVAVPGFVHDGLRFVGDAVSAGAVAVVAEAAPSAANVPSPPAAWAQVDNARAALGPMSDVLFGHPSGELTVVGVTGTNGKTTVTALLEAILASRGPVGRWSTTTVSVAGEPYPAHRTTPEGPDLQAVLRRMVDAGCWAAAIEVSSHALTLNRVDGTAFAAAAFTNLSTDHLDFHADMDAYLDAKSMLFERLPADGVAVLNVEDPASAVIADRTPARIVGYGWKDDEPVSIREALALDEDTSEVDELVEEARRQARRDPVIDVPTYWIRKWGYRGDGSELRLQTPRGDMDFESPLFGPANAENLAAAIALAAEIGVPAADITAPVAGFHGARGRFQRLTEGQPFGVIVDFAHTPDALRAALAAARDLAGPHRVIVVFGCGGDRDRGKRPQMGAIAAEAANQVLVTSDNPRSEDPDAIIDEIVAGIDDDSGAQLEREVDRKRAIELALERARPGDCVLIAGKGHETEQVFADRTIAFDDAGIAGDWLRRQFRIAADPAGEESSR